jgi:hypothetical protein
MCRNVFVTTFLLLVASLPASGQDPLNIFDGMWVSVNPPGTQIIFNRVGGGSRQVSLPLLGLATIGVSDGKDGSNLKVSGPGFDRYYLFAPIGPREMTWDLKSGSAVCPRSGISKKGAVGAAQFAAPAMTSMPSWISSV